MRSFEVRKTKINDRPCAEEMDRATTTALLTGVVFSQSWKIIFQRLYPTVPRNTLRSFISPSYCHGQVFLE